jgi:hypothetical protein
MNQQRFYDYQQTYQSSATEEFHQLWVSGKYGQGLPLGY